jgi:MFS family permease
MAADSPPLTRPPESGTLVCSETEPAIPLTPAEGSSPLAVLRAPGFAWFLAGTTLTNTAHWIQAVTLSWLVYDLTSSGTMLGTLNLVRSLATVGLIAFAGVAIDRLPRRELLYATSLWLVAICLAFGFVLLGYPAAVWPLFLYSFLGGVGEAVCRPLRETVLFSIVPRSQAPGALALIHSGWAVMRSIGPAIGGFLLLWIGPAGNFFVQAVAYALVTLTVLKLKMPYERRVTDKTRTGGSFREGWAYIFSQPTTLTFLLMGLLLPLVIIPNFSALPPIYAKDVFGGGPDTLGALLSAIGVGGIAGGFVVALLKRCDRRGLLQLGSLLLLAASFALFALSTSFWMALVLMALAGFAEMIYLTTNATLLQLSIPDELRGRVTGIISLRSGLMPVGAFIAGIGSDLFGPRTMSLIFGVALAAITIAVYFTLPVVRDYRLSRALEDTGTTS